MNPNPALALIEQARMFPAIVGIGPQLPVQPTIPASLPVLEITLTAGQIYPLNINGDFIFLQSITEGGQINIGPVGRPLLPLTANKTFARFKDGYKSLQIQNPSVNSVTIRLYYGYGDFRQDADIVTTVPLAFADVTVSADRPANATPYTIGDQVLANALSVNSIFRIINGVVVNTHAKPNRIRLWKSTETLVNAQFRVYAYSAVIATAGDNNPFQLLVADMTSLSAVWDFTDFNKESSPGVSYCEIANSKTVTTFGSFLFCYIVARGAYIPGVSETFGISFAGDKY